MSAYTGLGGTLATVGAAVSFVGLFVLVPALLLAVLMGAFEVYLLISGKNLSSNGIVAPADVRMPVLAAVIMVVAILLGYALIRLGRYLGER